jgi:hypothetical protein
MAHFSHQNEDAKCNYKTILERARCLILKNNTPAFLWTKAMNMANYLININPNIVSQNVIPEELYIGKQPNISHLRVYNCLAFVHVLSNHKNKH